MESNPGHRILIHRERLDKPIFKALRKKTFSSQNKKCSGDTQYSYVNSHLLEHLSHKHTHLVSPVGDRPRKKFPVFPLYYYQTI